MSFLTKEIESIRESGAYDGINDILQLAIFNAFSKGYSQGDIKRMFDDTVHAKTLRYEVRDNIALDGISILER